MPGSTIVPVPGVSFPLVFRRSQAAAVVSFARVPARHSFSLLEFRSDRSRQASSSISIFWLTRPAFLRPGEFLRPGHPGADPEEEPADRFRALVLATFRPGNLQIFQYFELREIDEALYFSLDFLNF